MPEYTQGPWKETDHGLIIAHFGKDKPDGGYWSPICRAEIQNNGEANMSLILAAPEMYEALDHVRATLWGAKDSVSGGNPHLDELILTVEKAMAKAEGRRA